MLSSRIWAISLAALFSSSAFAALHDRGSGFIYDDVLDVTWLQDTTYARTSGADADGLMTYTAAKAWASSLAIFDPIRGTTFSGWRLPRVAPIDGIALKKDFAFDGSSEVGVNITDPSNELPHLANVTLGNPANVFLATPLGNVGPFTNISPNWEWGHWYWTETEYPYASSPAAYYFDFIAGMQNVSDFTNEHYAWAVRDGDVGVVPEPGTMLALGGGLIAVLRRRKAR